MKSNQKESKMKDPLYKEFKLQIQYIYYIYIANMDKLWFFGIFNAAPYHEKSIVSI